MSDLRKRLGKVRISKDTIRTCPDIVESVFGKASIMEHFSTVNPYEGCLEFLAISEYFDIVSPGCAPPIYEAKVSENGETLFVKRCEEEKQQ